MNGQSKRNRNMNIISELAKPFPESVIHWRVGATDKKKQERETGDKNAKATKGVALAYINARDVMERLDLIVGAENWQDRYPYSGCCEIGISSRLLGLGGAETLDGFIWKSDGAGKTDVDLPNEWYGLTGKPWDPFVIKPKLPAWATPNGWRRIPPNIKRDFYSQMIEALSNDDQSGVNELLSEFDQEEQVQLWSLFDSKQRSAIKSIKSM